MPSSSLPALSVKFFSHKHLSVLNLLLRGHGQPDVEGRSELPAIGYTAWMQATWGINCNLLMAAGFLRVAEGVGILEGLTSNPLAAPEERHVAIDAVVKQLLDHAVSIGLTSVIAWTSDAGTLSRSERHGFEKRDSTIIVADLRNRR